MTIGTPYTTEWSQATFSARGAGPHKRSPREPLADPSGNRTTEARLEKSLSREAEGSPRETGLVPVRRPLVPTRINCCRQGGGRPMTAPGAWRHRRLVWRHGPGCFTHAHSIRASIPATNNGAGPAFARRCGIDIALSPRRASGAQISWGDVWLPRSHSTSIICRSCR
jgi:hypothetical protein